MVHGVHIISELLEIIINNNTMNLQIAEIEGDAVLFYKYCETPDLVEIYAQCQQMFISFHEHLKLYERDRICDCGSCSSTPELTLKFIVHFGNVIERNIHGHFQLMGPDVTLVHKLMKNNVPGNEYLLLSENITKYAKTENVGRLPKWSNPKDLVIDYDNIGSVNYQYENMSSLLKEVKTPPKRSLKITSPAQFWMEQEFDYPIKQVFDLLTSLSRKEEWSKGLIRVEFEKNQIERIGTEHNCITSVGTFQIETIMNEVSPNKMTYGESTKGFLIFPPTQQVFTLTKITEDSCQIRVDVHFKPNLLTRLFFNSKLKATLNDAMEGLDKVLQNDNEKTN
jgi:uncharacterized protein YndB with AHSA1/START domain